jgi:hypothetical protein
MQLFQGARFLALALIVNEYSDAEVRKARGILYRSAAPDYFSLILSVFPAV